MGIFLYLSIKPVDGRERRVAHTLMSNEPIITSLRNNLKKMKLFRKVISISVLLVVLKVVFTSAFFEFENTLVVFFQTASVLLSL